ncbi:MAG TPA: tetratricopeptide repeat protein, partial [Bacteroidales bacterium]|nr:tetratricopeptide repeat protein [Bacteroidales bacterium]
MMKRIFGILVLILIIVIGLSSCNKGIIPGLNTGKTAKSYDESAFNYFYVEAVKQKLMGNAGEALKYLEQAIKLKPSSDAAYYQMAQIVLSNRDLARGKKYAAKAHELQPGNIWYLMTLAGIYYQEAKLDSAIIYYEKAVKQYPEKENLKMNLGNLYSENGNYDKAGRIFSSIDRKYGVNESTTLALARNLMAAKKYSEARVQILELLKQNPEEIRYNGVLAEIYRGEGENEKALEVYKQLIERNPDNPQTQLALCDFLIAEEAYDDLIILLNTVALNNKIEKQDKIELFAHLLEIQDVIKNYENKLRLALMVLEANYKNDDVIVLLRPELLTKAGKFTESAQRLEEIVKIRPENYFAWEKLLLTYYELKEFKKLMERGEAAATRFNRSFLAKILYAQGAAENEQYQISLEELRKAAILAGDNKDLLLQVLTMKADVYYRMKEFEKSFEAFEEALSSNKDDLTVLNNYAYYLAEQDMRLKEAEEMAKKVIMKESENNTFLDTYAWVLFKRG